MHDHLPLLSGASGAAFLLRTPTKVSATIEHLDGLVQLISGSPCITVALSTVPAPDLVRDECWRIVQESLDIRAATHREAFATRDGESNFVLWQAEAQGYSVTIVDTIQARWQMQREGAVPRPPGAPPPPQTPPPVHYHPALRYYRLSQLTDDLFDAFRNAYLALENLVSEVSPKGSSESEQHWLRRVLDGPLASALPSGLNVDAFVESVYQFGRLPLFHAKSYATYYLPHGEERSNVLSAFEMVQQVLAQILHHRISQSIAAGWGQMSDGLSDAMARSVFSANQISFKYGIEQSQLNTVFEVIEDPRHFGSIWGRTPFIEAPTLAALERIDLLKDGTEWMSMRLPAILPLTGVTKVQIVLRQVQGNKNAPSRLHAS